MEGPEWDLFTVCSSASLPFRVHGKPSRPTVRGTDQHLKEFSASEARNQTEKPDLATKL
jgi:hypothetical protein